MKRVLKLRIDELPDKAGFKAWIMEYDLELMKTRFAKPIELQFDEPVADRGLLPEPSLTISGTRSEHMSLGFAPSDEKLKGLLSWDFNSVTKE